MFAPRLSKVTSMLMTDNGDENITAVLAVLDLWSPRSCPLSMVSVLAFLAIKCVVIDVLFSVHSLRGWWASFWATKQDGNKEFGILGRRGRRRPVEAWQTSLKSIIYDNPSEYLLDFLQFTKNFYRVFIHFIERIFSAKIFFF